MSFPSLSTRTKRLALIVIIGFIIAGIMLASLAVTGLLLSSWIIFPILVFLGTVVGVVASYIRSRNTSQLKSSTPDNPPRTSSSNKIQEEVEEVDILSNRPEFPQHAVTPPSPPPSDLLPLGGGNKEFSDLSQNEKTDWVWNQCRELLKDAEYTPRRFDVENNTKKEEFVASINFSIHQRPITSSYQPPNQDHFDQALTKIEGILRKEYGEAGANRQLIRYNSSPNLLSEGNILINQKAIDERVQSEILKIKFREKIREFFRSHVTLIPKNEHSFLLAANVGYFRKNDIPHYQFYKLTVTLAQQKEGEAYLNWLRETINQQMFNGRNIVQLRVERHGESSELKLEVRNDYVNELFPQKKAVAGENKGSQVTHYRPQ